MKKKVPAYNGTLRDHTIMCPYCISECSGIRIFGKRIKSIAFSTDVAIIKNINADAIIAVYPFTPQAAISQSIISISDVPVFVGVGGGLTGGKRSVRLALQAEHQGAYGVVVNAPIADEVITEIKRVVDIPVIATIASVHTDVRRKLEAGADILNVSGAAATASMVAEIRKEYPDVAIIATGGPTNESILETIEAGANAITYTPPSNGELFARTMRKYRENIIFFSTPSFISCGKIYNSSGTMPNIQFRKYSLQIRTICHIFPDFFLCRLLSNSLILLYNNFNRVPDRERARLGGSSYEEYSVYCIGGGSIYQNRRFGRRCRIPSKMF